MGRKVERARIGRVFGPRGHDGVDAGPLRTGAAHGRLDLGGHGALRHARADGLDRSLDAQVRDAVGLADDRDLRRRLHGPQVADRVLHVEPLDARQRRLEGPQQIGPHETPTREADSPERARIEADVGQDLAQTLDDRVRVILVGVGELAQDAHVGDPPAEPRVLVALRAHEHDRRSLARDQDAGGLEVHREVGQPAGVRRPERGPIIRVGHEEVQVPLSEQGLDASPAPRILLDRDRRSGRLERHGASSSVRRLLVTSRRACRRHRG